VLGFGRVKQDHRNQQSAELEAARLDEFYRNGR